MVKGLEEPSQAEADDTDVDSGSLNEEGSYYSEDSVTTSTGTDNESAASESNNNDNTTDPLINFSDVGKPQEGTNDFSELMSKGALESWLDDNDSDNDNRGSSQNVAERIPSARISIGDISTRIKPKVYTLLDPTYGNGLKVVYKYSSEASTISPSLVSVDTFFETVLPTRCRNYLCPMKIQNRRTKEGIYIYIIYNVLYKFECSVVIYLLLSISISTGRIKCKQS
ncbi:hypothetical protein HanHA300_Chr00c0849g0817341 [Helianthus annuus]|nr:hypothetical protein HanHA300_Chr00c0849g0817341 [Helianthus annuus]